VEEEIFRELQEMETLRQRSQPNQRTLTIGSTTVYVTWNYLSMDIDGQTVSAPCLSYLRSCLSPLLRLFNRHLVMWPDSELSEKPRLLLSSPRPGTWKDSNVSSRACVGALARRPRSTSFADASLRIPRVRLCV
jgi:hypothetical protein